MKEYKGVVLPSNGVLAKELGVEHSSVCTNSKRRQSSRDKYTIMKLGILKKQNMNDSVVENLYKSLDDEQIYIKTIRHKHKFLMFLGLLYKAEIDAIKGV